MTQASETFKAAVRRFGVTLMIAAACVALVGGGRALLAERTAATDAPAAVGPQAVLTARYALSDGYSVQRRFTGQIEPAQRTAAAFEFGGTIAEILVNEGDAVAAGAPLARLDARLLEAERDRLRAARTAVVAQAELAARTTERQSALQARGVASSQALDAASLGAAELTARIAEIDATLAALAIRLGKATIRAPFAGRVAERHLDVGASAEPGRPVVSLVETAGPVFRVGLPQDVLRAIPADGAVSIEVEGAWFSGRLRAVSPELDPVTRARTALFALSGEDLPAWRSVGVLSLGVHAEARGAWVPVSALEAGPRGLWRLMTVTGRDGIGVVGTEAVEILHADADRAFVRGSIGDGAVYITDGAHRVAPGQQVRPVEPGA